MTKKEEQSEKERKEIEKLDLEIRDLKKPFLKKPSNWLSITLALVAVGGFFGQSLLSNIKVERALLDAAKKTEAADAEVAKANALVKSKEEEAAQAEALRIASERAVEEAKVVELRLAADRRALRHQIDTARSSLDEIDGIVQTLRDSGVNPGVTDKIAALLGETSEALGRSCSPEDAQSYDKALLVEPQGVMPLIRAHFPWGKPVYTASSSDIEDVVQPWWIGGHSPSRKIPIWVGYRLNKGEFPALDRTECWRQDPRLRSETMARLQDYRRSGYDRGHLVPRADMTISEAASASTYLFTNLTPQARKLNRGALVQIEQIIREWAQVHGQLYVRAGPVFDHDNDSSVDGDWNGPTIGDGKIPVPTHFFRIVLREDVDGSFRALAFLHPNIEEFDRRSPLQKYQVTINTIEKMTGLSFFPEMNADDASKLKNTVGDVDTW